MNQAATTEGETSIKEEDVIAYLRNHPDFFLNNSALLPDLTLPHPESGTAVSLIERQIGVLREEKSQTEQQLKTLHQTAQNNEHLLKRLQHLIVLLIQSDSLEQTIGYLRSALLDDFHADSVVVHLYDKEQKLPNSIDPDAPNLKSLKNLLEKSDCFCGRLTDAQKETLFGENASEIASAVVIPLAGPGKNEQSLGILAIGSVDPTRYSPDMGTVFINHLGTVINTIFISHLEL
ncbi:MAG: DUF484 family protein [Gammaproteobacteria bacterium]|nr:DUF484 family protein [Gammaproteobacteria bacterium]